MFFGKFWRIGIAACGALIAVAALGPVAVAQPSDPSASISDNGSEVSDQPRAATTSRSFEGRGRHLRLGEKDDARATPRTRLEEDRLERRLRNAKPIRATSAREERGSTPETIIGTDERSRVSPTTRFPARATVLVLFSDGGSDFLCSGFLIGADTVVTAGHCVGPGNGTGFYNRSTYAIFPGRDGGTSPYGSCNARKLYSVSGWLNSGRDDFDYGAIKLDCNIGNTTGWYGLAQNGWTVGTGIRIFGYPGDKPLTQWRSADSVRVQDGRRVFYQADTTGGMSGSPVWFEKNANCPRCVLAIHAYGTYNGPPFSTNNHGTRINSAVFDNLAAWKKAP